VSPRPFRFGLQLRPGTDRAETIVEATRAEAAGFDVVTIPDHIGVVFRRCLLRQ
jgi:alkanesulfonate monooxygenase SsuD/methylene tetrahydromethanopterin reductase-like flavin-dependent oxidoreductase (luciferase family)